MDISRGEKGVVLMERDRTKRMQCPCCGYFTICTLDEVIVEICNVCFWQYDLVAQMYPYKAIGPNHGVSLNEARENYKEFGACDLNMKQYVRGPLPEELPENNDPPLDCPREECN